VGRGELSGALIGARDAVRRPGDGGEGGGSRNSGAEHARARGAGKWGVGMSAVRRGELLTLLWGRRGSRAAERRRGTGGGSGAP
jgi:hypothetical protein